MNRTFFLSCATLGPLGYLPMPGTVGSLAALALIYANVWYAQPLVAGLAVVIAAVIAYVIISRAAPAHELSQDPQSIILDELVGCMVTFLWVPLTIKTMLIGFILFRLLDIFKPFGIARLERLGGALGIMADDIAAGIISNILLRILMYYL